MKKNNLKILVPALFACISILPARAQEIAPEILPMKAPVVVNFKELADYELMHPVKHKKRFIEQGEDREKNGGFIPQPISKNAIVTNIPTPQSFGPLNITSAAPVLSFNGTLDNGTLIPPDIRGAAGPNNIMETTNQEFKIYNKTGGAASTLAITTFFSGSGGSGFFDPHVVYDSNNGRFVICIDGNYSNNHTALFIAVSQTSDPSGSWWIYSVDATGNTTDFMDYPLLGLNTNWVVVTGRNFLASGTVKPTIFVWNRASVYAGTATTATKFTDATNSLTLAPAHTYDNAQTTEYLVCNFNGNSGGSGFVRISTITGTPAAPVYTVGAQIGVAFPWNDNSSIGTGASQSGTTTKIESGDTRIGNAVYTNGSLWFSHTAYLPATTPTRSAVDWWQVNPATSAVQQFGRIDSAVAGGFNYYSSIAVSATGDALIGYCHSSSNMFPSAAYSFHASTDASGVSQSMYVYKNGAANYNKTFGSGRNRYGDYTGCALDPVNNSFWSFCEWAQTGNNWGTVIANVAGSANNVLTAISTSALGLSTYCAGANLNVAYTATGVANGGNIFTAQLSNGSGSFASPVNIGTLAATTSGTIACTIPLATVSGTGYRIRVVSSNPAVTGTDNGSNFGISALPVAVITGANTVCGGTFSQFCGTSGFATYQWSTGAISQCVVVGSSGIYTVTVANSVGCTSSVTRQLTVIPLPTIAVSPSTGSICKGDSIALSATGGISYLWNPSTGLSSPNAANTKASPAATTVYTVIGSDNNGCSATSTASISVKALPSFTLNPTSATICPGNSVVLTATGSVANFVWTPSAGLSATTGASVTANPVATTLYNITGIAANGCTKLKTINVAVSCPKPTGMVTTNITKNGAKLNWSAITCAASYKVQYRKTGTTAWTNITTVADTFRVLTGLIASTSYEWRVATRCPSGTLSAYTAITTFTTPALRKGDIAQGISSNEFEMVVYPNPTKSEINISFNNIEDGIAQLRLYDAFGKSVLEKQVVITDGEYNEPLNLSSFKSGIYVLQLVKGSIVKSQKVVKE